MPKKAARKGAKQFKTKQEAVQEEIAREVTLRDTLDHWAAVKPLRSSAVDTDDEGNIVRSPVTSIQEDMEKAGPLVYDGAAHPNEHHRRVVWDLAMARVPILAICEVLNCAQETLQRNFAFELANAHAVSHGTILRSVMREAVTGNIPAAKLYAQIVPEFREKRELSGPNGGAIPIEDKAATDAAQELRAAVLGLLAHEKPAKVTKSKSKEK